MPCNRELCPAENLHVAGSQPGVAKSSSGDDWQTTAGDRRLLLTGRDVGRGTRVWGKSDQAELKTQKDRSTSEDIQTSVPGGKRASANPAI